MSHILRSGKWKYQTQAVAESMIRTLAAFIAVIVK